MQVLNHLLYIEMHEKRQQEEEEGERLTLELDIRPEGCKVRCLERPLRGDVVRRKRALLCKARQVQSSNN